jgi:hypothetical protein
MTWYCLRAAKRLGYITEKHFNESERDLNGVGKPLARVDSIARTMPREIDWV